MLEDNEISCYPFHREIKLQCIYISLCQRWDVGSNGQQTSDSSVSSESTVHTARDHLGALESFTWLGALYLSSWRPVTFSLLASPNF